MFLGRQTGAQAQNVADELRHLVGELRIGRIGRLRQGWMRGQEEMRNHTALVPRLFAIVQKFGAG